MQPTCVILQSSYLPWRGYFDLIKQADTFVFLDSVQFTRRDWRTRNTIRSAKGGISLSVPVHAPNHRSLKISDVTIASSSNWKRKHLQSIAQAYARAPFREEVMETLSASFSEDTGRLSVLNRRLISTCWNLLSGGKPKVFLGDEAFALGASAFKMDRIISICEQVGAKRYLSGPTGKCYLDPSAFRRAGIELAYIDYSYAPYFQVHGGFDPFVSIIDVLMNLGPGSLSAAVRKAPLGLGRARRLSSEVMVDRELL